MLEGHGPVGASLPMRAAALIADESLDRIAARERLEEVLMLERELMNGRSLTNALELAAWAEEGVRRLLREAALGELGGDLIGIADENLIVGGLAEGDAQISVSAEEDEVEEAPEVEAEEDAVAFEEVPEFEFGSAAAAEETRLELAPETDAAEPDLIEPPSFDEAPIEASADLELPDFETYEDFDQTEDRYEEDEMPDGDTRILEPIPAEDEIKITATPWLDEISDARPGDSLEWPAPTYESDRDIQHREKIDTPRVRHLFPVPDSDWDVSHLEFEYDRRSR